jgi:O-antigen ligase
MQILEREPNFLYKILVFNFFFFLSWNGIVPAGELLRPYVIAGMALFIYSFIEIFQKRALKTSLFFAEDLILLVFLIGLLVVSLISAVFNLNYIVVYFSIIIIFYFMPKMIFTNSRRAHLLFRYNSYSVLIISIFALTSFFTTYIFNVDIFDIFPRIKPAQAVYGGVFSRSYGPSAEPGAFVFYLETIGVIGFWYYKEFISKNICSTLIFFTIFSFTIISTFSAGGVAAILVASTVCFLILLYRLKLKSLRSFFAAFIVVLLGVIIFQSYLSGIIIKLKFGDTQSANSRTEIWHTGSNLISENFLTGIGLGQTTELLGVSLLSFYATLLAETGVIVLLLFLVFLASSFLRMLVDKNNLVFVFALVAGTAHLLIISTFYYPFIFLVIVMASIYCRFIRFKC